MTNHTTAFFQERMMNGVLSHRISPRAPWVAYTAEELSDKLETTQAEIEREVTKATKELTAEYDKKMVALKTDLLAAERKRVADIIDTEDELTDELPSDHKHAIEQ